MAKSKSTNMQRLTALSLTLGLAATPTVFSLALGARSAHKKVSICAPAAPLRDLIYK
jgi:hypothetical protein